MRKNGLMIAGLCLGALGQPCAAKETPNFINIMVDDMGYSDLGCMGGEVQTPNIDRLSNNGTLFTNYRTYPKCFPTRNSIMTGMDAPPVRMPEDSITLGEALKLGGYSTYFIGKTHGKVMDNFKIVQQRGFDRSFGNEDGGSYWDHTNKQCMLDGKPWNTDKPFFKTDVQTDFAIRFLREHDSSKPFFLHLAYHAPHYPIHARKKDIEKYVGTFMEGPAALRHTRFARMKTLGLIPEGMALSPELPGMEEGWKALSDKDKRFYDLVMAGYCAMIDNVDQNIGRLLKQLDGMGYSKDTVIFFSSDNGACPEGSSKGAIWPGHMNKRFGRKFDSEAPLGSKDSHWLVGPAWANYSNTPLRKWKGNCYEGGLSAPFIVYAPGILKQEGVINRAPIMVMDVMPTILDMAGVVYPKEFNARVLKPIRGLSFKAIFESKTVDFNRPMHFFQRKTITYILYPWKIVSSDGNTFELYNLDKDRSELNDLADEMPEKRDAMMKAMKAYRDSSIKAKAAIIQQ